VAVPLTFMYPAADIKSSPEVILSMNSRVEIMETADRFARLRNGRYVFADHLKPISSQEPDFVAVAERFLNVPYLWGGKTFRGLDCSGLIQTAMHASGLVCPRDTDMQEKELGVPVQDHANLARGDLLFWKGHAGMMVDRENLLHANAHHMLVTVEPLEKVITRIAMLGGQLTGIRRL
jgi:cell wall-associated NlpC family hydrolase